MDPLVFFRPFLYMLPRVYRRVGPKLFWALMTLSVIVTAVLGCRETYS